MPGQKDASPLAAGLRFHDESLSLARLPAIMVLFEVLKVRRQHPCIWEEIILILEILFEGHETFAQIVFS